MLPSEKRTMQKGLRDLQALADRTSANLAELSKGIDTLTATLGKPVGAAAWTARHANVQGTDPIAQIKSQVSRVADRADVVTWNELSTPDAQAAVRALPGMECIIIGQLAVSWRSDVFTAGVHTFEKTNGGVKGVTPSRGVLSVELTHAATGLTHWQQVTHVVHHIEVGGLPRVHDRIDGQNERAFHHFEVLAASVTRHSGTAPVHGAGDLNVDYLAEARLGSRRDPRFPYTTLGAVATLALPSTSTGVHTGTHGGRLIDWGWTCGPALTVASCTALPAGSSDHNPVEYTVTQIEEPS
jgi:hypothetical protein